MLHRTSAITPRPGEAAVRSWRVTTAVRVFVLALASGQILSAGRAESVAVTVVALVLLAAVCCAIETNPGGRRTPWVTVVEAVLAAVLIGTAEGPVLPLLLYLVVPPVVAGIRHGWVTTTNTSLASGAAMAGAWVGADALGLEGAQISGSVPWLLIGMGGGLLASWQSRSVRTLEFAQAPYVAAHDLVSQLHTLTHQLPMGLDSITAARALNEAARSAVTADRSAVMIKDGDGELMTLVTDGAVTAADQRMASVCAWTGRPRIGRGPVAVPLRVGEHSFGVLLVGRTSTWSKAELSDLQELADTHAVRLDTALLFDDVRSLATTEERNRLARDIHDGVAQEIVSLGYLADEIADTSTEPATQKAADELRAEITRVVSELRFSIFDLRHDMADAGSFSGALAEYIREVSHQSNLRAHLMLDERGARLPQRVEQELLRIAQEAIGNVRKHAEAINLWVTLTSDGERVRLVIEDDGVGAAAARPGHYGLHTMRERAERIDADLTITPRADGGTVVTLQSRTTSTMEDDQPHDDKRAARR